MKFMGWHQRFGEMLDDSDEVRVVEKPFIFVFIDSETKRAYSVGERWLVVEDVSYLFQLPSYINNASVRPVVVVLQMEVLDSRDDEYPDTQCSGRELPALERLTCRHSESVVKQMITPPTKCSRAISAG